MSMETIIAIFTGMGAFGSIGTWFRLGKLETRVDFHHERIQHLEGRKKHA